MKSNRCLINTNFVKNMYLVLLVNVGTRFRLACFAMHCLRLVNDFTNPPWLHEPELHDQKVRYTYLAMAYWEFSSPPFWSVSFFPSGGFSGLLSSNYVVLFSPSCTTYRPGPE